MYPKSRLFRRAPPSVGPLPGRRALLGAAAVLPAALVGNRRAFAQLPAGRSVRIVVPYPPGGPNDLLARLVGQMLQESAGISAVIENRGGAAGAIGAEFVAKAAPDGLTLLFGAPGVLAVNPAMNRRVPYDPVQDFVPVAMIATAPTLLVCHPAFPARTVKDVIAHAKAAPGRINYASAGIGSTPHLAGELFKSLTGVDIVHVPYKGGGPAATDLIAGQVQLYFAGISAVLPFVRDGRLRAIAVTGAARTPLLPSTPTFGESGIAQYEVENWYAVLAPRGTPSDTIQIFNAAIQKGLGNADMRRRIADHAAVPVTGSPALVAETLASELEKWQRVVREAGIRSE